MNKQGKEHNAKEPVVAYQQSIKDVITDFNQLDLNKLYTYANYMSWKFSERVELIKGKIF